MAGQMDSPYPAPAISQPRPKNGRRPFLRPVFGSGPVSHAVAGQPSRKPNVKTLGSFEPQIWPEIITSRAESACFKGSRTSCDVIVF